MGRSSCRANVSLGALVTLFAMGSLSGCSKDDPAPADAPPAALSGLPTAAKDARGVSYPAPSVLPPSPPVSPHLRNSKSGPTTTGAGLIPVNPGAGGAGAGNPGAGGAPTEAPPGG